MARRERIKLSVITPPGGGGGGSGGGSTLLFAQTVEFRGPTISGAYAAGATSFTLTATLEEMQTLFVGEHILIDDEEHRIETIDILNRTITTEAGLAQAKTDVLVLAGVLIGVNDTIQLPIAAGSYSEIDVRFLYDLPRVEGLPAYYSGRSVGTFYAGDNNNHGSWFEVLTNFGYWQAFADTTLENTYAVGLLAATQNPQNSWSLQFNPSTGVLSYDLGDPQIPAFFPRIRSMIVGGR